MIHAIRIFFSNYGYLIEFPVYRRVLWKRFYKKISPIIVFFLFIGDKNIDKDLLYNDFNHLKSKFVQLKDKFGGTDKQIQEFVSSNLISY